MTDNKQLTNSLKREPSLTLVKSQYHPIPRLEITDLSIMKLFDHPRINEILSFVRTNDHTIMDLSEKMDLNPGSVKRYLDKLLKAELVQPSKIEMNKYHIKLKYYRITANFFEFKWQWPPDE